MMALLSLFWRLTMTLIQIVEFLLGREVTLPVPPDDEEMARLGLSSETVQLVYLEGLGWVYQMRPDATGEGQHESIDALIQAHKDDHDETQADTDVAAR